MIDYTNYTYDEELTFSKQAEKERYEKQLGDFGEQLVMTLLGRIKKYSVALVDHEGADLITSDKETGKRYAVSVKSAQIGNSEGETKVFKKRDREKLCAFAKEFDLIPAVAMIIIPKDFAFIDVYLITLDAFDKLAAQSDFKAISKVKNGLQINNYSLGQVKNPKHYDKYGYLKAMHENELINHVRLDVRNRDSFKKDLKEYGVKYNCKSEKDGNLPRQLGEFGEYLLLSLLGQTKKYKVARVDHVGADLIATDRKGKKFAISVKTKRDQKYSFDENYLDKKELSKLETFSQKYKDMESVIACVFIRKNFSGADIYIATLNNWLDMGLDGDSPFVNYKVHVNIENVMRENWKDELLNLEISGNTKEKREALEKDKRIEHIGITFDNTFDENKEW